MPGPTPTAFPVFSPPFEGELSILDAQFHIVGADYGEYLGALVSGGFDFDGDGRPDLALGAYGRSYDGVGVTYLISDLPQVAVVGSTVNVEDVATVLVGDADIDDYPGVPVGVGDLDGDGMDDLAIGVGESNRAYKGAGAIYIFYGPILPRSGQSQISLGEADVILTGSRRGEGAGTSVAAAGDVNGDGYADVIVGAPGRSYGSSYEGGGGYLLYGPIRPPDGGPTQSLLDADVVFQSDAIAVEGAGTSVAGAGDVNGDGYDDVLIGAPDGGAYGSGATYLLYGPPQPSTVNHILTLSHADRILTGDHDSYKGGSALSAAGDLDLDGMGDFVVLDPGLGGYAEDPKRAAAYVCMGATIYSIPGSGAETLLSAVCIRYDGGYAACEAAAMLGDVNKDGMDDLAIGSWGANSADVIFGWGLGLPPPQSTSLKEADFSISGSEDFYAAIVGQSVSSCGDVNGDGVDDFLIGDGGYVLVDEDSGTWTSGVGRVSMFYGRR